ncbi:alanine--tRNA ligase [Caerostris extrusa]|uniref:alanine--tRNA ligase n=1 Tax=Caerostris extrusa TaxID=172846 RepID=A0AAV4MVA9_CAEEX|nr:alanine--tRNA ligase [Caerostris extrusa]
MIDSLIKKNIPSTEDSFKYYYNTDKNNYGVNSITSEIIAIFKGTEMVSEVEDSNQCILVTDKTNFYSNAGGQISDIGVISNQDLTFKVENVSSYHGYVFHHGLLTKGKLTCNSIVNMDVEKEHRLSCSQNHTATHIMNSVLRKLLPYAAQRSSHVCPSYLKFSFSAKAQLTDEELEKIETLVNQTIQKKLCVLRKEFSFEELLIQPNAVLLRGEEYPEVVSVIFIGELDCNEAVSIEPCCGTHVHNTADIESFVLIPSKSQDATLENSNVSLDVHLDLLKQIKATLKECHIKTDAPLRDLKEFETLFERYEDEIK